MLSQTTKQEIFDTFLNRVNGKGRAFNPIEGICSYAVRNHPGCAVGCQPQFQKACKEVGINMFTQEGSIKRFIENPVEYEKQLRALKLAWPDFDSTNDYDFFDQLQRLHDNMENWEGLSLKKEEIKEFADKQSLLFEVK